MQVWSICRRFPRRQRARWLRWLARSDARLTTFGSLEVTDLKVTVYGTTAIATGTFASRATYKAEPFEHRGRFTDTWVRLNGKWLCVASHQSLIKKD